MISTIRKKCRFIYCSIFCWAVGHCVSSTLVRLAIEDETLIWAGLPAWLAGAGQVWKIEKTNCWWNNYPTSTAICDTRQPPLWNITPKQERKPKPGISWIKEQKQWVNNNNNKENWACLQKLLSVGFEGLLKGFPPQLKFENEEVPNLREASQCLRSTEPPRCPPCTGYYQLRGEGRGGATFVLLKLMGPPIDPQAARRHTREEEETPCRAFAPSTTDLASTNLCTLN